MSLIGAYDHVGSGWKYHVEQEEERNTTIPNWTFGIPDEVKGEDRQSLGVYGFRRENDMVGVFSFLGFIGAGPVLYLCAMSPYSLGLSGGIP